MNIEDTVEECALDIFDGRGVQAVIRSALIKQESEFKLQRDELLEALEELLADYVYADGEGVIYVSCADSAKKARAAIAKAKGETK